MSIEDSRILVRNYCSHDLTDVKGILFEYPSPTGKGWTGDMVEAFLSDAVKEQPDGVLVSEISGKVVGFAVMVYRDWLNIAYLDYIQAKKEWINKDVGHKLIEKCLNWAQKKTARIIYTETARTNARAIRFYERHGFQITGCIPEYYQKGLDAVILVRKLDQDARRNL